MANHQPHLLGAWEFFGQEDHVTNQVLLHWTDVFGVLEFREIMVDLPALPLRIDPETFGQFLVKFGGTVHQFSRENAAGFVVIDCMFACDFIST